MARAGFYIDDLQDIQGGDLEEAAQNFADEYHQIDESGDIRFEVYVEDDDGVIHEFKMQTDFDPVYSIESSKPVSIPVTQKQEYVWLIITYQKANKYRERMQGVAHGLDNTSLANMNSKPEVKVWLLTTKNLHEGRI